MSKELHVAYFSTIQSPAVCGPDRFSEYLGFYSSSTITFTCFTDSLVKTTFQKTIRVHSLPILNKLPGYWLFRSYLFYKYFKLYGQQIDVLLCSNALEALFLVLCVKDKPLIVMVNDDNSIFTKTHFFSTLKNNPIQKTISRYIGYSLEQYVTRHATKIISCSTFLKNQLIQSYRIPEDKITVLYPSVDIDLFKPILRSRFSDSIIQVLFIKHDWRRGGLDTLIEGLSMYKGEKRIQLNIVGVSSKEHSSIMYYVNKYAYTSNIRFCGILDKTELLKEFNHADVLILPSRQEAFGIAILEALATGTPVIASLAGGIPEVLDGNKAGLLIPSNSPLELAMALQHLVKNPTLVLGNIDYGISHCKKFSTKNAYSNLEKFFLDFYKEHSSLNKN